MQSPPVLPPTVAAPEGQTTLTTGVHPKYCPQSPCGCSSRRRLGRKVVLPGTAPCGGSSRG
eukprot:1080964-Amphidinium_carterae.1